MPSGASPRGHAFVGVSGFGYPTWRGDFYPASARPPDFLAFYAARLPSVELNATGRRFPTVEQLERWANATPESFRFAVKLTAAVVRRPDAAPRFCEAVRSLGERLGPILVPLPALGRHDAELAGALFAALEADLRYAIEPKDDAWDRSSLRAISAHLDAVIVNEPLDLGAFSYFRFRDPPYSTDELASIATRIEISVAAGTDVYGYFKHEDAPTGPRYAQAVLDGLSGQM